MNIIKLTHFSDLEILNEVGCCGYAKEMVIHAIAEIKKTAIQFNYKTGVTKDRSGFLSSYTSYEPQPVEDTVWNEFKPWIMNYCSKLSRGLAV